MSKEVVCCRCKHPRRFHAVAERHPSGVSCCTKIGCFCREFLED